MNAQQLLLTICLIVTASGIHAEDFDPQQVIATYCANCHGEKQQKGERRFDQLRFPLKDADALIDAQDMIDQLVLEEMPPPDAKQPDEQTRKQLIAYLRKQTTGYHAKQQSSGGETVLRRLNRREYRNTVRNLLQLDMQMFDPARNFPTDELAEHFDNVGNTLVTSGFLLEQYLIAADQVIEKALSPETRPDVQEWHFQAPFEQQGELVYSHKHAYGSKYLCIHETTNSEHHWGEYAPILKFEQGVPHHGRYEIRVLVEGKHKDHPHPRNRVDIDKDEPMRIGIVPGHRQFGKLHHPQPFDARLAEIDIPEGEPTWQSRTVWMDKGFTPRFIYINGGCANHDTLRRGSQVNPEARVNTYLGKTLVEIYQKGYDNPAAKLFDYVLCPGIPMDFINAALHAPWSFMRNTDDQWGVKIVSEEAFFLDWGVNERRFNHDFAFPRLKRLGFKTLAELRRFLLALDSAVKMTAYDLNVMAGVLSAVQPAFPGKKITAVFLKQFARDWMEDVHTYCNVSHWQNEVNADQAAYNLALREFRRQRPSLQNNLGQQEHFGYLHPTNGSVVFYGSRLLPDNDEQHLFVANMEGAPCTFIPAKLPIPGLPQANWQPVLTTPGLAAKPVTQPVTLEDSQGMVWSRPLK